MYRASQGNWIPKIGGFLLVPVVGGVASHLLAPLVGKHVMKESHPLDVAATVGALANAAVAFGSYKLSTSYSLDETAQAFARGGAWSSGIGAAFHAVTPLVVEKSAMPAVTSGNGDVKDKVYNLLVAKNAAAVASARMKDLAALRG